MPGATVRVMFVGPRPSPRRSRKNAVVDVSTAPEPTALSSPSSLSISNASTAIVRGCRATAVRRFADDALQREASG